MLYERADLGKVFGLMADSVNFDKSRYICIIAGCDHLANLPGIGLAKSKDNLDESFQRRPEERAQEDPVLPQDAWAHRDGQVH